MNIAVFPGQRSTRAADGLERRLFTVADAVRMFELGILEDKFELLEGEIVPMMNPAKQSSRAHKTGAKLAAFTRLARPSATGRRNHYLLSDITFVNPDLSITPPPAFARSLAAR